MSDLRQTMKDKLSERFGTAFHGVHCESCSARVRYDEIRELFGSQETCDLLSQVAPRFFSDVRMLFWNDLVLHVTRLTDKSKSALSVQSLEPGWQS